MNKITFPFNGINNNSSYETQPLGTCASASNVRGYDAIKGRLRGGQRPGLSKYIASQINGSVDIHDINYIKTALSQEDPSTSTVYCSDIGDRYLYAFDTNDGTRTTFIDLGAGVQIKNVLRDASGNIYILHNGIGGKYISKYDSAGVIVWHNFTTALTTISYPCLDTARNRLTFLFGNILYAVSLNTGATVLSVDLGVSGPNSVHTGSRVCIGQDGYYYVSGGGIAYGGNHAILFKISGAGTIDWRWVTDMGVTAFGSVYTNPGISTIIVCIHNHAGTTDYGKDATSTETQANVWILNSGGEVQSSMSVNKDTNDYPFAVCMADDADYYVGFKSIHAEVVYVIKYNGSDDTEAWDYYISSGAAAQVWHIEETNLGDYVIVTGTREATWENNDGSNKSVWMLDELLGATPPLWTGDTTGTAKDAALYVTSGTFDYTTAEVMSIVVEGDIYKYRDSAVSLVSNGSDQLRDDGWLMSQPAYNDIFFVDGQNSCYLDIAYDTADDEIKSWVATSGSLPVLPRLVALYRGRIVLGGQESDPHNWYMSKVGDPFDWDYSPATTSAIQAVAGNNSEVGLIGDNVNGIAPWSDDLCIFGCDSSIWVMAGDPAAGGSIDLVTDKTGMTFGKAWCFDPNGVLYFHGVSGIYRLIPGGKPESITDNSIKRDMENLDLSTYYVRLYWDINQQGLYMVYMAQDYSGIGSIRFWDQRQEAWWKDAYLTAATEPRSFYPLDADNADDRYFLMGCKDGYIRKVDNTATTDDGTGITSEVILGPYIASPGKSLRLTSADITLGKTSGNLDLYVYSGDYAEDVIVSLNTRVKRTLKAGLNRRISQRVKSAALKFKLQSPNTVTTQWALENLSINIKESGTVRGGRV
jgi:hypothetical protein